ncbi:hypothetical protein MOC09_14825, partial [Bacillus sp. N12A5]|uniref:hypothetical protein n=1 Tax=Bacillus sp. N12A5 TaxID=2918908 RepID=UPI002281589E|nr:hypothetical protein [Bacillus sp. N12A5]
ITDKLSAIGCLKGVLIPVSKTGVSPYAGRFFNLENSCSIAFGVLPLNLSFFIVKMLLILRWSDYKI